MSDGSYTFILEATSFIALVKQADQPTANNCSGLVPLPGAPGTESFTPSRPIRGTGRASLAAAGRVGFGGIEQFHGFRHAAFFGHFRCIHS